MRRHCNKLNGTADGILPQTRKKPYNTLTFHKDLIRYRCKYLIRRERFRDTLTQIFDNHNPQLYDRGNLNADSLAIEPNIYHIQLPITLNTISQLYME